MIHIAQLKIEYSGPIRECGALHFGAGPALPYWVEPAPPLVAPAPPEYYLGSSLIWVELLGSAGATLVLVPISYWSKGQNSVF